ncbi:MAG: hypothetical protein J6V83_03335 [Clostridia bacterium]|nr:hypothetical protein [Clostridia bacterium]
MENIETNEQNAVVPAEACDKEEPASSYGKFKTVEELKSAYNALEAEFTRRSQRIKELEGQLKAQANSDKWSNRVKNLNERYPISKELGKEITDYLNERKELLKEDNCLEQALLDVLANRYKPKEDSSYQREDVNPSQSAAAGRNEGSAEVYSKIISGGGHIPVVKTATPHTVGEANKLAAERLKNLKEKK